MYTFRIEVRGDWDEEQIVVMREAAKMAAKHIYASAALISQGKRKPEVALTGQDFFTPEEEIMLAEDIA